MRHFTSACCIEVSDIEWGSQYVCIVSHFGLEGAVGCGM